jgi:quercetin dioxygenase-like cupin family protein
MNVSEASKEHAGKFEFDPCIVHHFSSGVYAKQMTLPAGATVLSHAHDFDHLSILAQGHVLVKTDDSDVVEYLAPIALTIKAGVNHAIHALEDSSWFCIHATEETDPNKVDKVLIKKAEV